MSPLSNLLLFKGSDMYYASKPGYEDEEDMNNHATNAYYASA